MHDLDYGRLKATRKVVSMEKEIRFTEVYRRYEGAHPYQRELNCLEEQMRNVMVPMQGGEWFSGRLNRLFVGIDPERGDSVEPAYFCQFELLKEQLDDPGLDQKAKDDIRYLLEFWGSEATYFRVRAAFPEHLQKELPSDNYYASQEISYPMFGFGGPVLDYYKLLKKGLPGLAAEVQNRMKVSDREDEDEQMFLKSLLGIIQIVKETAERYRQEAACKADDCKDEQTRKKYQLIAKSLENVQTIKPATFHEAVQLTWLYNLISHTRNYGRMDNYLGDFLAADLKEGILTRKEALDMLVGLWNQIIDRGDVYNNRIVIGGRGRRHEKNADQFAILALEAQQIVNDSLPQLSLRWHKGMNKELWDRSFEVLATGSTFPILYNDDVNVRAVGTLFDVSEKEAEMYYPYGCGEYIIEHRSVGSPDAALNVLKALDVTLHNGIDSYSGKRMGLALGPFESFATFDAFRFAFARQIEHQVALLADAQSTIYNTTGKYAAFPALSLLYDDCIARAKPILGGGVRYLGGTIETFGNNSAADVLYAIKTMVYDKKVFSHASLLEMIGKDFDGFEKERRMLKSLPKFGNDLDEVDEQVVWINHILYTAAKLQAEFTLLDTFLVVNINNGDSVLHGKKTAASADGRKAGEPLSNGNQPSAGNDVNGITALLNSMAKVPAEVHAGMTHNIKLSRRTLVENSQQTKALIQGYFNNGGTQVMITSVERGELKEAIENPENCRHIFVRVGGYSERFVDLPRDVQREVMERTLY